MIYTFHGISEDWLTTLKNARGVYKILIDFRVYTINP
jgi:hypothetical protein